MQYVEINDDGDKYYYKDRRMTILHREDGPAVDWFGSEKHYYLDGKELTEEEFNNRIKPKYCSHCGEKLKETQS